VQERLAEQSRNEQYTFSFRDATLVMDIIISLDFFSLYSCGAPLGAPLSLQQLADAGAGAGAGVGAIQLSLG